jgi:hypothetical protein
MVDNEAAMLDHFVETNELLQKIDHQMDWLIDKLLSSSIPLLVSTGYAIFVFSKLLNIIALYQHQMNLSSFF